MRFISTAIMACAGKIGRSSNGIGKRITKLGSKLIATVASCSIAFMPIATSFIPQHAYAQQIIIDPSAPSTSLFSSGNGTPQINIATPQSGVSQNKFDNFNVGSDGVILNNSQSSGTSVIGGTVGANSNLATSGPATVILNEVTGTNGSTLTGTTEVFGGKAAVIIANPNGIGCNGCSFINTSRTTLATGKPTVSGSDIGITVTQGSLNIGRGGFNSEGSSDLIGRHITIDGAITTEDDLIVSGGAQYFNYNNSSSQEAPTLNAKKSPFAVDATEFGALTAGNIRVHGNESGLGVNTYGDINTTGNVRLTSKGDLYYGNITSSGSESNHINARHEVRQYGDAKFSGDVNISGRNFTLYKDRKLETSGDIAITASKHVIIVGEVSGQNITIDTAQSITNNGFIFADGELLVVAGDDIVNEREVATEYDTYYDPVIQEYLEAYQAQLLSGDADERAIAAEFIARAAAHEIIQQYVERGATLLGEDVTLEANFDIDLEALAEDETYTESGDIRNIGGAIIGTRNIVLRAGENIINEFVTLQEKLNSDDGCDNNDCGYRENYFAGEILSGGNISLSAGLDVQNRASNIGAAGNITVNAGQDIINTLQTSNYETLGVVGSREGVTGYDSTIGCSGGRDGECYTVSTPILGQISITGIDIGTVLAPGQIVTLSGDVVLDAGRDFISYGSKLSAGGNVTVEAAKNIVLSSFAALEGDYEFYREQYSYYKCVSRGDECGTYTGTRDANTEDTKLIVSASQIEGNDISLRATDDISLVGVHLFAENDLSIQSTGGSILINSVDLPAEVRRSEFRPINFAYYDGNAIFTDNSSVEPLDIAASFGDGDDVDFNNPDNESRVLLFRDSDLANDFENFIEDNPVLAAVDTLRRVENASQVRESLRSVGLQSGDSIFNQGIEDSLTSLNAELETLRGEIANIQEELSQGSNLTDNERLALNAQLDQQIAAAATLSQEIIDFEEAANRSGDLSIQQGTANVGEANAAVALANFGFDSNVTTTNGSIDLANDFGVNQNSVAPGLSSSSSLADVDAQDIINNYETLEFSGDIINRVNGSGHAVEERRIEGGGKILIVTDTSNSAEWAEYIIYKNADGENEVYVTEYDDGRKREYTYGVANDNSWERHTKWYDADGVVYAEITKFSDEISETKNYDYNLDGKLEIETTYLSSGDTETATYYYASDKLSRTVTVFADGTKKQINFAKKSSDSYDTYETDYDSEGRRVTRTYHYKSGTKSYQIYDADSSTDWDYQSYSYNSDGELKSATKYNDDGSRNRTFYDYDGDDAWSIYTNHYDENLNLTNTVYTYNDGEFTDIQYNADGTAGWDTRTKTYSAEGVHQRTTRRYADGLKIIRYYDRDNQEDWQQLTVAIDASGSVISQTIVEDVEGTIAEVNYGKFFKDTEWRFSNAGGLAQLASTPRSVIYADNDLSITAGVFGEVQVEDTAYTSKTYSAPIDLAVELAIRDLTQSTGEESEDIVFPFPLFDAAISGYVTSATPPTETEYTNSAGDEVHRKEYEGGAYSIKVTESDNTSTTNYYNDSGVNIAREKTYSDGRIRNTVFADETVEVADAGADAATDENNWRRIDTFYTADGKLSYIDQYAQDNSRVRNEYDVNSDGAWSSKVHKYDQNGEIVSRDFLYDDGTRLAYSFDVTNEESWDRTLTHYNHLGQLETITEELDDDAGSIITTNDYDDTKAWARKVVTKAADGTTLSTQLVDDLDPSITVAQSQLLEGEDIYILGSTSVSAGNDVFINAGRRVGILGAVNTAFNLTGDPDTQHTNFDQIGENLQLGTLFHDTEDLNVGVQLDEDGNPVLDENGNIIRTETESSDDGNLETYEQTRNYRLTNTVVSAGNDLSINTSNTNDVETDIVSYGGSIVSNEFTYITTDGDVRNEALRRNFTLTAEQGCVGGACGREGHEYKPAEILAGSGLIIAAGGSVKNYGGNIGAAGAILITAEEDIINDAITSQYLYHYINKSSVFGLKRRKEILHRAIIQEGNISSTYGSITFDAGRDIKNIASLISAGGDISLDADGDIELYAKSEEVHNYIKRRSIGFLSISQEETRYNEFGTALSQLEGNAIYASAGNNLTGIGAQLFSATDIVLDAGNNLTFDAHQNRRYRETEGWSFGVSFPGSNIIAALVEGDGWEAALDAYIGSNPVLAAVHQIATADNSDQRRSGLLALGYKLPGFIARAGANSTGAGSHGVSTNLAGGFFDELNPFRGGPLDFSPGGQAQNAANAAKGGYASFLEGVTFRFSAYESREEWTESHISRITSGQDLTIGAGNDLALVGGTVSSASRDATFVAGNDLLVSALADTNSSESSSWGASIGFGGGGVTIGGNFSESTSNGILYTNAGLTAGETLTAVSGRDIRIAGANVSATDIYIDAGRDLIVQSRQNVSTSQSSGWNFSVTVGPVPGLSAGVNGSNSNRQYTDTPTIIEAENTLDIYTEGTTILLGAVLNSKSGDLTLDTGDFLFDNFNDVDQSESFSVGVSLNLSDITQSDAHGSYAYSNTEAVTYATVGLGEINIRNRSEFDFTPLNRDIDNVQRVVSDENFSIEIPGINLARWIGEVEQATQVLRAASARIPEDIRDQGEEAVDLFRDAIIKGFEGQELLNYARSENFQKQLKARSEYQNAVKNNDPDERLFSLYNKLLLGESVRIGKDGKPYIGVDCSNAGPCDDLAAIEAGIASVEDIDSQTLIDIVLRELNNPNRTSEEISQLAFACAIELKRRGVGDRLLGTDDARAAHVFANNPQFQDAFFREVLNYDYKDEGLKAWAYTERALYLKSRLSTEDQVALERIASNDGDGILALAESNPELAQIIFLTNTVVNTCGQSGACDAGTLSLLSSSSIPIGAIALSNVDVPSESPLGFDTSDLTINEYLNLIAAEELALAAGTAGAGKVLGALASKISPVVSNYISSLYKQTSGDIKNAYRKLLEGNGSSIETVTRILKLKAKQAVDTCGPGSGCVYGTKVHTEWRKLFSGIKNFDTEKNFLNGDRVRKNALGSVRLDAIQYNDAGRIVAIYDLKTGSATLTQARINQIRSHLPDKAKDVPIIEIKP